MRDVILLRFRDLIQDETVETHNRIAKENGSVIWGWWKKPLELMPDPGLINFKKALADNLIKSPRIFFINSSNRKIYKAYLEEIYYEPDQDKIDCPDKTLSPTYYNEKKLPAWFRIREINEIENEDLLSEYVFSESNRTSDDHYSTALNESEINSVVTDEDFLNKNISLWFIKKTSDVGILNRNESVRNYSRGVWNIRGNKILHLSDIHFGEQHAYLHQLGRKKELKQKTVLDVLIQDLESQNISPEEIGLIFVTGDLTWKGDAHEFENAKKFLGILARKLGLHRSQILIIPGNHDIEWRDKHDEIDIDAEVNYRNFISDFYSFKPNAFFSRVSRFRINGVVISIASLNSCRIESEENAGLGYVGNDQIHQLLKFYSSKQIKDDVRIALIHHHILPVNYVESIDWDTKKVSLTLDSEGILRSFIYGNFNILFHGHQHQPYYSEIKRVLSDFVDPFKGIKSNLHGKIALVGSGSLGVKQSHINSIARNSYNIISVVNSKLFKIETRLKSGDGPGFYKYSEIDLNISRLGAEKNSCCIAS